MDLARRLEPDLAPEASTYNSLGALYEDMRRCGEGAGAYQHALRLWEKLGPPGDRYLLRTATNLVSLYLGCGDLKQAERLQRALVEPRAKALDAGDPEYTRVLANRGTIQLGKHHHSQASALYEEALHIGERSASIPPSEVACLLHNLGVSLARSGNAGRAIESNRRALEVLNSAGGPPHSILVTLINGARILCLTRRCTEAEPLVQRALALAKSVYGDHSPTTAAVLGEYATVLRGVHRNQEAAAIDWLARQIQINAFRPGDRQTVDVRELSKFK